jgi:hypothetical protein
MQNEHVYPDGKVMTIVLSSKDTPRPQEAAFALVAAERPQMKLPLPLPTRRYLVRQRSNRSVDPS